MQTAVQLILERGDTSATRKHLRVGVNSAMVDSGALIDLLIRKGVITEDEISKELADKMEQEVKMYRKELNLPDNVELG
jgi:hypothetical protein